MSAEALSSKSPSETSPATGPAQRIDPETLMKLKTLELRARAVVEGFLSGLHRSPYHGFSAEFSEYREYSPGDDPRYLDWKLFARSDRYYIKRFEEETNLACWLLLDLSRSMGFGSGSYSKADYARTAAATLAYFLTTQRDAVGLVTFDESIGESLPARFRPSHLHRVMLTLENAVGGTSTSIDKPLEQIAATVSKRGLIVLLTDMLAPLEGLETNLGYLRARGHEVLVVRILDPREIDFKFEKASMFRDAETGREFYVDPESAEKEYRERFDEHAAALGKLTQGLGIDLVTMRTDEPLDSLLFDFIAARTHRAAGGIGRPAAAGGRS